MPLRIMKVITSDTHKDALERLVDVDGVVDYWASGKSKDSRREYNFLISSEELQKLSDRVQNIFKKDDIWRLVITPVETSIPRYEKDEEDEEEQGKTKNGKGYYGGLTREALYDQIFKGAQTNTDYYLLVLLSIIVATIGVVTSNVAIIIGAMVIAPLLGPNLALSFGVILGEKDMIRQAVKANTIGLGMTLLLTFIAGLFLEPGLLLESAEFIARTDVGFGGIVLALASGAAAVLSLTSGVSSTMVGVMVAVALMPPAVVIGMAAGAGMWPASFGATLLLAINIICVNISVQLVLTLKGVRPRTWYQKQKSKRALKTSLMFWSLSLAALMLVIFLRSQS